MTALHVALLRRLAAGERIPAEWMTGQAGPQGLADLVEAGLARWSAGGGKNSADGWSLVDEPGTIVTPAGRAALLFYELGREAA